MAAKKTKKKAAVKARESKGSRASSRPRAREKGARARSREKAPKPKKRKRLTLEQRERKRERDRLYQRARRERIRLEKIAEAQRREKKREKERARRERRKVCAEFFRDPVTAPEIVFGSDCFLRSEYAAFSNGGFEGAIWEDLSKRTILQGIRRLELWTAAFFREYLPVWGRVWVYGKPPKRYEIDRDEYSRFRAIKGRPELTSGEGAHTVWYRLGPTPGERTFFKTPGQLFNILKDMAKNFHKAKFKNLVLELDIVTGKSRPA